MVTRVSLLASTLARYVIKKQRGAFDSPWRNKPLSQVRLINLKHRADRLHDAQEEFESLGLRFERVEAVLHNIGLVGCARSHVLALNSLEISEGEVGLIAEDDFSVICSEEDFRKLVAEFSRNQGLDVLCLSHESKGPFFKVSENLQVSIDTQTTALYLVKKSGIRPLVQLFESSAEALLSGSNERTHALDILWKTLQRKKLVFAIPLRPIARQRASLSDIQGRFVNYGEHESRASQG